MHRVGVIGGGQLARMMHPAAIALGIELKVFAEQEHSSAHQAATKIGDYTDYRQLQEFAKTVDVVTFDHEHVPVALLEQLEAEGLKVYPGPTSLIFAQNKALMRRRLAELGLPLPAWQTASDAAAIEAFIAIHGPEIIVKTPVGGYDGKGVRVVSDSQQVSDWLDQIEKLGGELLLEEKVPFVRELAQLVARNPSGDLATYEVVQTVQKNGVCAEVIAPAPKPVDSIAARKIAEEIAVGLNVVGMMAVELFETADGHLVINELAMRPHNSGHYSIEGTATSQFEQHLRAVLDLPLGSTELLAPAAVMVNLLGVDDKNTFTEHYDKAMRVDAALKFHSYEKSARVGRKMGHITALGDHPAELLKKAHSAAAAIYNQI